MARRTTTKPGEPRVGYEDVTPAMARQWVDKYNTHNRTISEETVDTYARDMAAEPCLWNGRNGATITFAYDEDGEYFLSDGQQRLEAVVRSGKTIELLVIWGAPVGSQATTDVGRGRTFKDTLRLESEARSTVLAPVLKREWLFRQGIYRANRAKTKPSRAELLALLEANPTIRADVEWAAQNRNCLDITVALAAFARWRFSQLDATQAHWFMDRLVDLDMLKSTHPIQVLSNRIQREQRQGRYDSDEYFALMCFAWNGFRGGMTENYGPINMPRTYRDERGKQVGGLTNETFPVPE